MSAAMTVRRASRRMSPKRDSTQSRANSLGRPTTKVPSSRPTGTVRSNQRRKVASFTRPLICSRASFQMSVSCSSIGDLVLRLEPRWMVAPGSRVPGMRRRPVDHRCGRTLEERFEEAHALFGEGALAVAARVYQAHLLE